MTKTLSLFIVCLAVAAGFDLFLEAAILASYTKIINFCGIAIIMAVSLNVINGLTGQFSLGHAGFMAIGGYVSAYFTTPLTEFDPVLVDYVTQPAIIGSVWGLVPALIIGGVAAAAAGLVIGLPTLRLKGDYLAIATLGFSEVVRIMITNFEAVGGANGLSGIPQFTIGDVDSGSLFLGNTFFIFSFAFVCILLCSNLQRSTYGRALVSIRENELAAEIMGIPVTRLKVTAFIYGAFFAGIAGGLLAQLLQTVTPQTFNFMKSIEIVVMLVLGGLGSMTGAVVGAIVMTILPEALRPVEQSVNRPGTRMVFYSLTLILLMIFRPQGIFGQRELSLKLLRSWLPFGKSDSKSSEGAS